MEFKALVCIACLIAAVQAYPRGPPTDDEKLDVCTNMFPTGHNVSAMNGVRDAPFEIHAEPACYKENSIITIKVYTNTSDEKDFFEGLFIQARAYHSHEVKIYGMFSTNDTELKTHDCFGQSKSALSQSEAHHYYEKTFMWHAGNHRVDLQFVATIVHETDQFWLNVTSKVIKYDWLCMDDHKPPVQGAGLTFPSLPTMLSVVLAGILALFM